MIGTIPEGTCPACGNIDSGHKDSCRDAPLWQRERHIATLEAEVERLNRKYDETYVLLAASLTEALAAQPVVEAVVAWRKTDTFTPESDVAFAVLIAAADTYRKGATDE